MEVLQNNHDQWINSMKRLKFGLITILALLVTLVVFDITMQPETQLPEIAAAERYLYESDLPRPPNEFHHDGCTLFPDQVFGHNLTQACLNHDIAYWAGGDTALRKQADLELKETIAHTGPLGHLLSYPMYFAVKIFGESFLTKLLGANWGYGWNQ